MIRSIVALFLALQYIAICTEAKSNFVEKFRQMIKDTSEEKTEIEESWSWLWDSSFGDNCESWWSSYMSLDDDLPVKKCGIRNEEIVTRIVNGEDAERGGWPWQAMLYKNGGFTCGGTYIGGRFILTAAHCFGRKTNPSDWKVNLGKTNFGKDTNEENGEFGSKVSEIIIHKNYDNSTNDNDIALMVLKKEVPQDNAYINMACYENQVFDKKSECFITGWGVTTEDGLHPDTLQEAKVPIIDRRTCIKKSSYSSDDITVNMLCAGYITGGTDTCQGDSGGPLVCNSPDACGNNRWYLVGVTSWGYGCARDGYPGVYTNVANYIDWIKQQINSIK